MAPLGSEEACMAPESLMGAMPAALGRHASTAFAHQTISDAVVNPTTTSMGIVYRTYSDAAPIVTTVPTTAIMPQGVRSLRRAYSPRLSNPTTAAAAPSANSPINQGAAQSR